MYDSFFCEGNSHQRYFGIKKNVDLEKEQFLFGANSEAKKSFQDIAISESLVYALRANQKSSPHKFKQLRFSQFLMEKML